MPFELFIDRLRSTGTAIYHKYNYEHLWNFSQNTKSVEYKIHNPIDQKFFITIESISPRLKPHGCEKDGLLNIHLYDENYNKLNAGKVGVMMWVLNHHSLGSDPEWTKAMPKGTYILKIINWRMSEKPKVDYTIQVYADQSKVTVNGVHGEKFTSDGQEKTKDEKPETKPKIPDSPPPNPNGQLDPKEPSNGCTGGKGDVTTYVKKKDVDVFPGYYGTWEKFHSHSETFACGMRTKV